MLVNIVNLNIWTNKTNKTIKTILTLNTVATKFHAQSYTLESESFIQFNSNFFCPSNLASTPSIFSSLRITHSTNLYPALLKSSYGLCNIDLRKFQSKKIDPFKISKHSYSDCIYFATSPSLLLCKFSFYDLPSAYKVSWLIKTHSIKSIIVFIDWLIILSYCT